MDEALPTDVFNTRTDNLTLLLWAEEFLNAGLDPNDPVFSSGASDDPDIISISGQEWFRVFRKIMIHFPSFMVQDSVKQYILDYFPIRFVQESMWVNMMPKLAEFFGFTLACLGEDFHIELLTKYPVLDFALKDLSFVEEHMPSLHSMLIITR